MKALVNHAFVCSIAIVSLCLSTVAQAGITFVENQDDSAWPATPTFQTVTPPSSTASAHAAQTDTLLSQTFTVTAGNAGPLGKVSIAYSTLAGVVNQTYQVRLQVVADPLAPFAAGTNLFSMLTFDPAVDTSAAGTLTGSAARQVMTFAFSGADQVTLVAGVSYAFEILSTTTASGSDFNWWRTGSDTYATGDGFVATGLPPGTRNRISTSGRDFALAYEIVPEPASAALCLVGLALIAYRRR